MATQFRTDARDFNIKKIALHGAVGGLFFAQTVAWQEVVDVIIVQVLGTDSTTSNVGVAFLRGVLVTLFTTVLAWGLVAFTHRCNCCALSIEERE